MNKELFTDFDEFTLKGFNLLYPALAELIPMKPNQKKELPYACKELSEYLTTDREFLSRPYWTSPRLLSAYCHYFMVWNLIRLCRLFPTLNLGTVPEKAVCLDLGSGPLTIPLALWLSRKDLRDKAITFICADIAPQPLQIGKKLFEKLRQALAPECPWQIQAVRTPNHKAFRQIHEPVFLLTMGNVLNEGDEKKKISAFEQIQQLYGEACQALAPNGKIFAVEPGTRQGARMLQILRNIAVSEIQDFEDDFGGDYSDDYADDTPPPLSFAQTNTSAGFEPTDNDEAGEAPCTILSPCPQDIACPLARQHHRQNAWCHFNSKAPYVPKDLKELSQKAGLDKESVSLSFLLLAKNKEADILLQKEHTAHKARIISDAFILPRYKGRARYACHEKGLLLIPDSAHVPAGTLCDVSFPAKAERDFKSKALLCTLKDNNCKSLKELEHKEITAKPDKKQSQNSEKKNSSRTQHPNFSKKKRH